MCGESGGVVFEKSSEKRKGKGKYRICFGE